MPPAADATQSRQAAQQLSALTGVRGLLCLWVWFLHIGLIGAEHFAWDLDARFGSIAVDIMMHGYLAVDMFFILSGFVLLHVYQDRLHSWKQRCQFWRARFARVYPLHLVTLSVVLAAYFGGLIPGVPVFPPLESGALVPDNQLLPSFLKNLLLVQSWNWWPHATWMGVAWSISAEAFMYLCFPLVLLVINRLRATAAVTTMLLMPMILMTVCIMIPVQVSFTTQLAAFSKADLTPHVEHISPAAMEFGLLRVTAGFIAGCCAYRCYSSSLYARIPWQVVGPICATSIIALLLGEQVLYVYPLLPVLILSLAAPGNILTRICSSQPLVWIGDRSYAVYMCHAFLLPVFAVLPGSSITMTWFNVVLATALLLAVCHVIYHLIEMPARRWLRGS